MTTSRGGRPKGRRCQICRNPAEAKVICGMRLCPACVAVYHQQQAVIRSLFQERDAHGDPIRTPAGVFGRVIPSPPSRRTKRCP